MSTFFHLLSTGGAIPFEYGDLEALYPGENYAQLTARRQSNWNLLKSICNTSKISGSTVSFPGERIEFFRPLNDTILINSGQTVRLNGRGMDETELVFYPFTMRVENTAFSPFKMEYGATIQMSNLKHQAAQQVGKFETYNSILKKGGNARLIEITDSDIRSDFWTSLVAGQKIYYSWNITILGETRIISSWDSIAKTITVTADIGAGVASDTVAYFGKHYAEDISEEDYNAYGNFWVWNELESLRPPSGIQHLPALSVGVETYFDFVNTHISNWNNGISISSGNFHITYNNIYFTYNAVALGAFARSLLGQTLIGSTMTMRYNGLPCIGQIAHLDNNGNIAIFGGGGYIHPTIVFHENEELLLEDNIGFQFKQFSTSIEILYPGQQTYIKRLIAVGGLEYDFYSSNSMPVVIDYIECSDIRVGGTITINDGEITEFIGGSVSMEPPNGEETIWTFNDMDFYGSLTSEYNVLTEDVHDIIFNNCRIYADILSVRGRTFVPGARTRMIQLNNCEWLKSPSANIATYTPGAAIPAGNECTSLFFNQGMLIEVNNLTSDFMKGPFIFQDPRGKIAPPFNNSRVVINNSEINSSKFTQAAFNNFDPMILSYMFEGSGNSIPSFNYLGLGYNAPQNFEPKVAVQNGVNILTSSQTYTNLASSFAPFNTFNISGVLEISDLYNEYYVNGGTINRITYPTWSGVDKVASENIFSGEITIHAVGSDIILNAYNSSTNQYGNVLVGTTIPAGTSKTFLCNNGMVLANSPNATVVNEVLRSGNGVLTEFMGYSVNPVRLMVPYSFSIIAGAVTGDDDGNGNIVGTGIEAGSYVDYGTGTYYLKFTSPVGNGVPLQATFDIYVNWRATGVWTEV